MSEANYRFLTRPSAVLSRFSCFFTNKEQLAINRKRRWCKGQIGGYKLLLSSLALAKQN